MSLMQQKQEQKIQYLYLTTEPFYNPYVLLFVAWASEHDEC